MSEDLRFRFGLKARCCAQKSRFNQFDYGCSHNCEVYKFSTKIPLQCLTCSRSGFRNDPRVKCWFYRFWGD
ncbi:hypothetical protein FGO68_gene12763 [Halteria grandinella]|uniref:Uncharacterized protein n=1 Tax=Halteria grandinella TaxID=5974 RepID=A0A8J8T6K8_HALGN|nr:hypothetical protein FGO68_gene12763 [Halteria grandinella]